MTDLATWLLDRIAEDEAVARDAYGVHWSAIEGARASLVLVDAKEIHDDHLGKGHLGHVATVTHEHDLTHIARHDPARVLAECAAKRRIVEDAINDVRDARRRPGWTMPDAEVDELGRHYRLGVEAQKAKQLPDVLDRTDRLLRLLGLPYADHDGYDPSWGVQ